MAVHSEPQLLEEEDRDEQEKHDGPTHHPSAPLDELFDISTTVDPSYVISLIRKLLPSESIDSHSPVNVADATDQVLDTHNMKDSAALASGGDMDIVDGSSEFSLRESNEDKSKKLDKPHIRLEEKAWEECGCVLWDLAASKIHAEFMVQNLILDVLLAQLRVSHSVRVKEISIGLIGNLACHETPMRNIVSTKGLVEMIVDQLFLDDALCLCGTCRLLSLGLQSNECKVWAEALKPEHVLTQIMWIIENTLNIQLIEKSIELILAMVESSHAVMDTLLPPLMKMGLANLLVSLVASEMSILTSERIPERYGILDVILRLVEALSAIDGYSQEICLSEKLFQISRDLIKFPDKVEVANSCVTAAVLVANILSDVTDRASELSHDMSFLQGLLDIFRFASHDLEARSALWSILARLLIRVQEKDMSLSSLYHYVTVLVRNTDLIEDDLLDQQLDASGHEEESTYLQKSNAKITSLRRIISILNQWIASSDQHDETNTFGGPLIDDIAISRLLNCCQKHAK